jgi:hypothetical protein
MEACSYGFGSGVGGGAGLICMCLAQFNVFVDDLVLITQYVFI